LTRAEVDAQARLRRLGRAFVDADALAASLADLVGQRVELRFLRFRPADPERTSNDAVGVIFARPEARPAQGFFVELDGALAASILAKMISQRAPRVTDFSRPPSPSVAGAIAAILLAALRRVRARYESEVLRVVAAGSAMTLARELAAAGPARTKASFAVRVGEDAFEASLTVPSTMDPFFEPAERDDCVLARLGNAPLAVPLVVATTLASRSDLNALATGDVFIPGSFPLATDRNGALEGPVAIVVGTSEIGIGADLADGGRLMVREFAESHSWDPPPARCKPRIEDVMSQDSSSTEIDGVLDDVPLVVRVELGVVEMTARQWASLRAGDVVSLGRKIGTPVVLRVGGVEIAQGELVQVDGDCAVRIRKTVSVPR